MSYFIDTHAHLYLPEFDYDRDKIIEDALNHGVKKIFLPNINSSSISPMKELADKYPRICYPMMGLHPTSVKYNYTDEMLRIEQELEQKPYIAIGEIGIDLYWDKDHLKEQCIVFARQIDLALKYRLPVIIHARESFNEILQILDGYHNRGLTGIFHAFTGTVEIARKVIDMNFKLGIGGILTYKKSSLKDVVRETDLKNIVLETDSPYLAPILMRGKRNESSFLVHIAEAVKNIKNVSIEEVASVTTSNVINLFHPENYDGF
jgi:TatD DNase family protein